MSDRHVKGRCPMGCGETLFLGKGGYVTCGYLPCPDPGRASDMLDRLPAYRAMVTAATDQVIEDYLRQQPKAGAA